LSLVSAIALNVIAQYEAISILNNWGARKIPLLFIIDFEMKAIRLFRLDLPLPGPVRFDFHNTEIPQTRLDSKAGFIFRKHPVSFIDYETAFLSVQKQIIAGNSFLTNLTFPTRVETNLSLKQLFEYSRARYKLLVDGEFVCFSPETFITIRSGVISTYPMKGTIKASLPLAEQMIMDNPKETAEHNTVVDLLRNDMSMVATDVAVNRFRYIDKIVTHEGEILQVSSEITGRLPADYRRRLGDILFAMLPAGSVTGAPKTRTIAIIREVEKTDRGYYTGICGIFDGENVDSAVMIRLIEIHDGKMRFRSGGGITFLSNALDEYNELIDKVYVPIA
jgi:para-aminobenzoate synthetase component 1